MHGYTIQEFKITDARDGQSRTVRVFKITEFFDDDLDNLTVEKVRLIIDAIATIQQTREQFGIQRNPIIVQSEDGSKRVCLFTIITHALERARFEGIVDIPEQVRLCKIMRPGCVTTFDEYKYIYNIMKVFIICYKDSWQSLEDVRSNAEVMLGEMNNRYLYSDRTVTVSGDTNNTGGMNSANNTNSSNNPNSNLLNLPENSVVQQRHSSGVYDVPIPSAYN